LYWIGYIIAFLAAFVVGWLVPLIVVAITLPLFQIIYIIKPLISTILMILIGVMMVYYSYSINRESWWQAILWGFLWGLGVLAAALGVFHWYSLFIAGLLFVFLLIPGLVDHRWINLLRWYAVGEIGFTLLFLWGQEYNLPGTSLVTVLFLLVIASVVGVGSYRPFEVRRISRRIAAMATILAVLLLLSNPVLYLAVKVSDSPIGRWYHIITLRYERMEIGERAKTESLRQLQKEIEKAHKARLEKAAQQIYNLPLSPQEWEDLGIPRQVDP
jgi:hypothetical protein